MAASHGKDPTGTDLGLDIGHKPTPGQTGAVEAHVPDVAASVRRPGKNAVAPRHQGILHQQHSRHGLATNLIPVPAGATAAVSLGADQGSLLLEQGAEQVCLLTQETKQVV
jgi:hypothetical protein